MPHIPWRISADKGFVMARNRSKRSKINIPSKYILLGFAILCVVMMVLSYTTDILNGPFETVAGYTIVPFQKGISKAGYWLTSRSDNIKRMQALTEENEELKVTTNTLFQQHKKRLYTWTSPNGQY